MMRSDMLITPIINKQPGQKKVKLCIRKILEKPRFINVLKCKK